jgi:hypothetical protein
VYQTWREQFFNFRNLGEFTLAYLTQSIALLLLVTNSSTNFFLYSFAGKKFRQEMVAAIRCQSQLQEVGKNNSLATNATNNTSI